MFFRFNWSSGPRSALSKCTCSSQITVCTAISDTAPTATASADDGTAGPCTRRWCSLWPRAHTATQCASPAGRPPHTQSPGPSRIDGAFAGVTKRVYANVELFTYKTHTTVSQDALCAWLNVTRPVWTRVKNYSVPQLDCTLPVWADPLLQADALRRVGVCSLSVV